MGNFKIQTKHYFWLILPVFCLLLLAAGFVYFKSFSGGNGERGKNSFTPQVLGAFTSSVRGGQKPEASEPQKIRDVDLGAISAESVLVYDLSGGFVFAEKNPDQKVMIASLTKLLTGLVVYEQGELSDSIGISARSRVDVQPKLNLITGDKVRVLDLFDSMIVGSANDAAGALAQYAQEKAGANFVELMNKKAKDLEMSNSFFSNPFGFDSQYNYSTARDLQKLVNATQKLAAFSNLGKKTRNSFSSGSGRVYSVKATNKLIAKYGDLEAIKTGFTENSKGSMISKLDSGGRQIVLIILGSQDREQDTLLLRKEILSSFKF